MFGCPDILSLKGCNHQFPCVILIGNQWIVDCSDAGINLACYTSKSEYESNVKELSCPLLPSPGCATGFVTIIHDAAQSNFAFKYAHSHT